MIVSREQGVLLLDTCALGDIIRELHRTGHKGKSAAASAQVLARVSPLVVVTDTVVEEWARNRQLVVSECKNDLRNLDKAVDRVSRTGALLGYEIPRLNVERTGIVDALARSADQLLALALVLDRDDGAYARAVSRAVQRRRPSAKGKIHDSLIVEHYLCLCEASRAAGFVGQCSFVSSNTRDYCGLDGELHRDLAGDFAAHGLEFSTDLSGALVQVEQQSV